MHLKSLAECLAHTLAVVARIAVAVIMISFHGLHNSKSIILILPTGLKDIQGLYRSTEE